MLYDLMSAAQYKSKTDIILFILHIKIKTKTFEPV